MNDYREYHSIEKNLKGYQYKATLFTIAILACFAAFASELINVWLMIALTSVMVTKWMIAVHEIMHFKKPEELDLFTRLLPLPFTPFNLGYREYRNIHLRHHRFNTTDQDPDSFHILGGKLKAFLGAISQQEQATFRYIRANGLSQEFVIMMLLRTSLFFILAIIAPFAFLQFWLALRITYIVNDYVFFHLVHFRSGKVGTFPIPLPKFILNPAVFIYGVDVVNTTTHHDIHHNQPLIAAKNLHTVANLTN